MHSCVWPNGRRLTRPAHRRIHFASAAMAGAAKCAAQIEEGVVVVIFADGGWKYLSTGAWTDDIDQVTERAKRIIYF